MHGVIVVPRLYTSEFSDSTIMPFDYNHVDIVKPANRQSDVYVWVGARIAESSALKPSKDKVLDGQERSEQPILQTSTIRLIDVIEMTPSRQKPFSMQTDTVNAGTATAYDVVVRQSAASGFDWRFDWKDESKNRVEMLAAQKAALTTTSTVPEFVWPNSMDGLGEFRTYIYGAVTYEERTSNHPTKHSYSYCYSLHSTRSKDGSEHSLTWGGTPRLSPADVISQFVECPKKPPVPR